MELYNTEAWAERRRPSNKEWEANVNFREVLDLFFKQAEIQIGISSIRT